MNKKLLKKRLAIYLVLSFGLVWMPTIAFTISCTAMGALLYLVTKKTGSVWPAVFMHGVNNTGNHPIALCVDTEKLTGIWAAPPVQSLIIEAPLIIMGVIAAVMICRMEAGNVGGV